MILALAAAAVLILGVWSLTGGKKAKAEGTVTVEVTDLSAAVLKRKEIDYYPGDSLEKLVRENFEQVTIENGMVMTIESLTTPADWSTFIGILKNGAMSEVGLLEMSFEDGDVITFAETKMQW